MILVTGGAGFIGSVIAAQLEALSVDVVICDRLRGQDKWRNIAKRRLSGFVWPEELSHFLRRHYRSVDAIVHMAAISSTREMDADLVLRTNFQLSRDLWQFCVRYDIPLVYASSGATYGDGMHGFSDDWTPRALTELKPLNLYGWSKHAFDRYVAHEVTVRNVQPPKWFGFKFMNVYGPNEYHKGPMRSMVSQIYDQINASGKVSLFKSHQIGVGDGQQSRDFVYVRDCADVVVWALEHCRANGIYNLGTGKARTFAELSQATANAMNRQVEVEYFEMPATLRTVYQYHTQADVSSLRRASYPREFRSLESGVAEYVERFVWAHDPYL